MIRQTLLCTLVAAGLTLTGADALKSMRTEPSKPGKFAINFEVDCRETVLPRLDKKPDLKNFPAAWQKAAKMQDFRVIYRRAVSKAKGMQAAGEWKQFLKKTLIPSEDTIIYMGYDDDNLYLVAECCEKPGNIITRHPGLKRDSKIYSVDSVELLIFRDRADADFKQFMSDISGQKYDALRNDTKRTSDVSWNPEYTVETGKKGDNWLLFWTLPWKVLNIKPQPGTEFALNVARNKIAEKDYSSLGGSRNGFAERDRLVRVSFDHHSERCGIASVSGRSLVEGSNIMTVVLSNPSDKTVEGFLTTQCNKAAKYRQSVKLPPKSRTQVRTRLNGAVKGLPASRRIAAANTVSLELLDKQNKVLALAMFTADAQEKLAVALDNYAITGTDTVLRGKVEVNAAGAKNMDLEIICGKNRSVIPAANGVFELNVADIEGECEAKFRLINRKNKSLVTEKVLKFSRESDPFA